MGTENISLEKAQTVLPHFKEIYCDTRNTEQYSGDIASWLTKQLATT